MHLHINVEMWCFLYAFAYSQIVDSFDVCGDVQCVSIWE